MTEPSPKYWHIVAITFVTLVSARVPALADIVLIGTGNPTIDVAAVQAAVDAGGLVRLQGTFSFDISPIDDRTILVSKGVVVEGIPDAGGNLPTIIGGLKPFQVTAPGQAIVFRRLRFVDARLTVIEVRAADDVVIEDCHIQRVEPVFASAIGANLAIGIVLGFFTVGQVGGDVSIARNHIDIGGTASDRSEAIAAIAVGRADRPVNLHVVENTVRNTVAHGIDIRNIVGDAAIERNDVNTGVIGGQTVPIGERFVDGIRILGAGSYLVAHNRVEVGYANAAGIRVQGGGQGAAIRDAVVFSNYVRMSAPAGATFGAESAGIEVRRLAVNGIVLANRIRGVARAAVALIGEPAGSPQGTTLRGNNVATFSASLADVYVGPGVANTAVLGGHGTVVDEGSDTLVKGGYHAP